MSGLDEKDLIHQIFAFMVGKIILEKFEVIHLLGETVQEDTERLRYYFAKKEKGENVILRMGGTSENFKISHEALSKIEKLEKGKHHIDTLGYGPFELLWKNIKNEQELQWQQFEKMLEFQDQQISHSEYNELLDEDGRKFREAKGYLKSEIPFQFIPGIQANVLFSELLSESDQILKLAQSIETAKEISLKDVLLFYLIWNSGKRMVIKLIGKKRLKKNSPHS